MNHRSGSRGARLPVICVAALALLVSTVASAQTPSAVTGFIDRSDLRPAARLTPPRIPDDSIRILGDSLFVGVSNSRYLIGPSLQEVLHSVGWSSTTSVRVGMTMGDARLIVAGSPSTISGADVILIGLGTNDIYNSARAAPDTWRRSIEALGDDLRRINPDIRIVWVDIYFERVASRSALFNRELREVAAGTADFEVCPWFDLLIQHPEWLGSDRLHLTGAGYTARRNLLLNCIGPR